MLNENLKNEMNKVFKYNLNTILYADITINDITTTHKVIIAYRGLFEYEETYMTLYGCITNDHEYIECEENDLHSPEYARQES